MHPGTRADRLAAALDEFVRSSPDVEAAAVVSFDGLPMASALPEDLEEDRLGAMSAALLSLGEQAALGLGRGMLNQIFVEGEHGFVFLMSARDQAVLTAIASRSAKIGFMLFEMRRAADRIGEALQDDAGHVVAPEAAGPAEAPTAVEEAPAPVDEAPLSGDDLPPPPLESTFDAPHVDGPTPDASPFGASPFGYAPPQPETVANEHEAPFGAQHADIHHFSTLSAASE